LRNEIIHKGDVPLEFGCEVSFMGDTITTKNECVVEDGDYINFGCTLNIENDTYFVLGMPMYIKSESKIRCDKNGKMTSIPIEILGKPVSLREVLLMMGESMLELTFNIEEDNLRILFIVGENSYGDECIDTIDVDLTRSPEKQDEEVLEKLIELLK